MERRNGALSFSRMAGEGGLRVSEGRMRVTRERACHRVHLAAPVALNPAHRATFSRVREKASPPLRAASSYRIVLLASKQAVSSLLHVLRQRCR